ncbi:hypothetical protein INR49_021269 [Caranx melampygus]|nr:hypothetical protein INR49_021269 [Caranx melampygus]
MCNISFCDVDSKVRQRNELGIYLINLSVADLLYITTLPLWIDYFLQHDDWIHAVLVSAIVWIIEIVANSAPLFHDELFQDRFNHTFCFEKYPMQDWVAGMNLYRTFLGFLAPWTAMLVAYRGILAAVRCNVSTERQEKAKIQRLALSLILIVLLCFGPYHVLLLVRSVMFLRKPCDCGSEESLFAAYHVSLALTSLNCVADPILYCFVNEGQGTMLAEPSRHYCLRPATRAPLPHHHMSTY